MTEGSEPINRLGVVDAEGNFTELAKIDYATDTDDLILAHTTSNGELRRVDADNSWKFNEPVEAPEASIDSDGSLFFGDGDQWSIKYNATAGSWVVRDETADGGVGEDVMTFNDAASAVELARSLGTETQPVPGTSHFESLAVDQLNTNTWFASNDAELTDVISEASAGDVINLANSEFTENRTVQKRLRISGTNGGFRSSGSRLRATWTFDDSIHLDNIYVTENIILNSRASKITNCGGSNTPDHEINADDCLCTNLTAMDIIFASGTSGGLVDASTLTNVTDNGTNSVGDIT